MIWRSLCLPFANVWYLLLFRKPDLQLLPVAPHIVSTCVSNLSLQCVWPYYLSSFTNENWLAYRGCDGRRGAEGCVDAATPFGSRRLPSTLHSLTRNYLHPCFTCLSSLLMKFGWHFMLLSQNKALLLSVLLRKLKFLFWDVLSQIQKIALSHFCSFTRKISNLNALQVRTDDLILNCTFFLSHLQRVTEETREKERRERDPRRGWSVCDAVCPVLLKGGRVELNKWSPWRGF